MTTTVPAPTTDPSLLPWEVDEHDWPAAGSAAEQLRFLLHYAVLAPSGHNAQPWRFRVVDDALELWADRSRSLPVVDPHDRELVISCGAALETLLVAARHLGHAGQVELAPEPLARDLLARFRLGEAAPVDPDENGLFAAITRRHTQRRPFDVTGLPVVLAEALRAEALRYGTWLHGVSQDERAAVADLVAAGDRAQSADRAFRGELAGWIRSNHSHHADGMRAHGFGVGDTASWVAPLVVRLLDRGAAQASADRRLVTDAPLLVVLGTEADDRESWLGAGRALQRVLLRAQAAGVRASFLNQPVERADLRTALASVLGRTGSHPQLLVRLGTSPEALSQPRRPAGAVLDELPLAEPRVR